MARKISRPAGRNRIATTQKTPRAAAPTRPREEELVENLFLGVLLFFLAIVVFIPVFSAGFIWDDDQLLTANPQVHSAAGWWTLWLRPETADYFPLTSTTLWLEYHLGQFSNLWNVEFLQRYANDGVWSGYHIMNVLFHATAVVLTWQTLKRLRIPGAWVAAAIFAVHPVCVESVAWISERKNTLSQIFFLLAILKYLRFQETGRVRTYVWAILCFTLSLLAKTSVVMLPFILLLLTWWRYRELESLRPGYVLEENRVERNILVWSCVAAGIIVGGAVVLVKPIFGLPGAVVGGAIGYFVGPQLKKVKQWNSFAGFEVIRTIPFFLVAFLLGLVTVYFQYGRAIGGEEIPLGNLWQRSISACFAAGFYLYSALWPFNIIEIYPQWHRAFPMPEMEPKFHIEPPAPEALPYYYQVIPGLIIAGLLYWCWTRRREAWARAMLVGMGCYILAMLPALGLLKMSYMRLTLVADHFQYISIVAVIALVVAAGYRRAMTPLWLGVAALGFAIATWLNWNQVDSNPTLYQWNHIGQAFWIAGALALAVAAMVPEIWKYAWGGFLIAVLLCSSVISFQQSEIYHSEKTLWTATLDKNPNTWQGHNHLGAALYMEGDVKHAYPHFLRATQLKPENPESHNNLGLALCMFGDMPGAIKEYRTAVGIKDDSAMETNLANALEQVKDYDEAVTTYRHAIKLNPQNASAHCNLGYALMQQGKVDEAILEFMETIRQDPRMPQGRADLAQALRLKGVNIEAPVPGNYSFNLDEALQLLRTGPMPQQPPQQ